MSVTHKISRSINDGGPLVNTYVDTITDGGALVFDEQVATAQTDLEFTFAFTKTKLKSIFMVSDQNVRICTNDTHSGSPGETINLVAGKPYMWTGDDGPYFANPFAGNVTALYITNVSGQTANIIIRGIINPTT